MNATSPSASRRWSRAASRAWIAVTARTLVTAIPASDAAASHVSRRCRRSLAPDEVVEPDPEHPGDQLEEAQSPPVALRASRRRSARHACWSAGRGGRLSRAARAGTFLALASLVPLAHGSPPTIAARMQPPAVRLNARSPR